MAHDSQVKAEQSESSEGSKRPAKRHGKEQSQANSKALLEAQRKMNARLECSKVIGKWMPRYAALPGVAFTDAAMDQYYAVLAECEFFEPLDKAFVEAQKKPNDEGKFFRPCPAEVLEVYHRLPKPAAEAHNVNCPVCRGTGWKLIPRTDGAKGTWAVHCDGKAAA